MPFLLQSLFVAIFMLIIRKPVQRRGFGEKCGFSLIAGRHQRVNLSKISVVSHFLGAKVSPE